MRKPVSKHALRRALEQVRAEGLLSWDTPTGSVVDRIWHQVERDAFNGRKKPVLRESVRTAEPAEV
jgi:DNA-binding GntR family transcriptional regulator